MKKQKINEMIINAEMTEMSNEQLENTNGGILPIIGAAVSIYGGICAVAYGAGALYGMLTK